MSVLEAILLGVLQGITEFLPISSSAHLIVARWLFDMDEPSLSFDAALHLGTLLAIIAYFWRDLLALIMAVPRALQDPKGFVRNPDPTWIRTAPPRDQSARLGVLILIATVPAALAGLFGQETLDDYFRSDSHRTRAIATIALLMFGLSLLLWAAERSAAHHRKLHHMTWQDAVMIGLAQATALLPGVSRSGSTITTGLFQGLARADAARFSFLIGTPITLAGSTKAIVDALSEGISRSEAVHLIVGAAASAIVGYLAIWWLLKLLQRTSTAVFIFYRIGFGIVLLFLLATGYN